MSKYKVMLRDSMAPIAKEILEATGEIEVVIDNDKATNKPEALAEIIGEYDGLGIRSGTKVNSKVLEKAPNLKVIGRAGIGVDNIDRSAATKKGVVVMNAPGGNTVTTAEHAISLMLSLARHIPQATASLRQGKWEKKKFLGVEITGKTLGILGLGQIGRIVAGRAQGLKMNVLAHDPFVALDAARSLGIEVSSLEDVIARSDFLTLHVPRLKETENMVNRDFISKLKPGARIINCSRGNVIDLDALYEGLESGQVGGAALDVFPKEPPGADLPILSHPKVVLTPHLGASTGEAQSKVAEMIARQMADYLMEGVINNAVNFPSVSGDVLEDLEPYMDLAERMGSMLGQLIRRLHNITITYSGELANMETKPLTHAVLKGMLGSYTDTPVNHVNAPALAKEKGMKIQETISRDAKDYTSLIRINLEGHGEELNDIWGTLFGKKYPRVVRLGRIYMDAIPEGPVLIIQNYDRPGVIGNIGKTLAAKGYNIGRFQLGRREGRALCMINLDSTLDPDTMKELESLPDIIYVNQVELD